MGLWRPDDQLAADEDGVLPYVQPAALKVDVADAQPGCLAPAQPAVRKDEYERSELPGGQGEIADLLVGQVGVRPLPLTRHLHSASGVRRDPTVPDGHVEDRREDPVRPDHGRGTALLAHLGHPSADVAVPDL